MIDIDGSRFVDEHGRTLLLRGVNLSGSSKVPLNPNGATHLRGSLLDHRDISFVGRPFPLSEADEHFLRLRSWGFTFLRFLVTWEAVEHAGPGLYDAAYLDYLEAVVAKAADHGISLLIDPHQDVWSRLLGGDGAPGWTLEAVGMEPARVDETGAAVLHQHHDDSFPHMLWPTNGDRLGASTMFTLFFAGDAFAPRLLIDGEPAQEYLQRHYCAAIAHIAARLRSHENVVGFETMNEPLRGYIGCADLNKLSGRLKVGDTPNPYQSMLLASGYPQEVPTYEMRIIGARLTGRRLVNPEGARLWRSGSDCIWQRHGVWEVGSDGAPRLLRPDYFARGGSFDFNRDCYLPFIKRCARAVRAAAPDTPIFVQPEAGRLPPRWGGKDVGRIAYAPHWYDPLTLVLRRYYPLVAYNSETNRIVLGRRAIRRNVRKQLAQFRRHSSELLGGAPVILAETGIPFDLDNSRAYRTGDFRAQLRAVDRSLRAVEATLLHCTWWNYTPDNDNLHGDQWNREDFSIFSPDQRLEPDRRDSGGRALAAVVRPYARATAGEPLAMRFKPKSGGFSFTFRHDLQVSAPTELYVPLSHYPNGCRIAVSDGTWTLDRDRQIITYRHSEARAVHRITITRG